MQIEGEKWKQWQILFSWEPKSLQMVTAAVKLKDNCSLEDPSFKSAFVSSDLEVTQDKRLFIQSHLSKIVRGIGLMFQLPENVDNSWGQIVG